MTQLKKVVEPFGEVNVYPGRAGRIRVRATILMEPYREGTRTGIALDGSGSMANLYGVNTSLLARNREFENQVSPVAQKLCAYLARRLDASGGTSCIYWATGPRGAQIETVGDFSADEAERHTFGPPRNFGTGTQLLPALRHFVERFHDAPWGFFVFITDGELHDLDAVKEYSYTLAQQISSGRRKPVKLVLVGVGSEVNEQQMLELDDLDTGTDVDLWDHKLASELRVLQQIFAEVVDENARVAESGRILDPRGNVVVNYSTGVPAMLDFEIDRGAEYFTLAVPGQMYHQALSDSVSSPAAELTEDDSQPLAVEVVDDEEEGPLAVEVVDDELELSVDDAPPPPRSEAPIAPEPVAPQPDPWEQVAPAPPPPPPVVAKSSHALDDLHELPENDPSKFDDLGDLSDDGLNFDLELSSDSPTLDLDKDDKTT